MKNQDEIDTAPVVARDDTRVTFESIDLAPGDKAELVLAPDRPIRNPILFMSNTVKESSVVVEQILHGRTAIFEREHLTIDQLRFGKPTYLMVTESEPIVIVVINNSPLRTTVGASLVTNQQTESTTYSLSGDQITQDKE